MKPRLAVRFQSSIPDEDVYDERGEMIFRGGAVARVLTQLLTEQGFECRAPDYGGDHGWQFLANSPARSLWISVISAEADADDYYLLVEDLPSWIHMFFQIPKPPAFADVLMALDRTMKQDGRFERLLWIREGDLFSDSSSDGWATPLG